jgi:hypothetical protein
LPAPFTRRPSVAYKATPALGVPAIICFNYNKAGHKSYACLKPQKPGIIHKIKGEDSDTNVTNVTNKDLEKEQA